MGFLSTGTVDGTPLKSLLVSGDAPTLATPGRGRPANREASVIFAVSLRPQR
jgi:hypothetical protein